MNFSGVFFLIIALGVIVLGGLIALAVIFIRALLKYIKSKEVRKKKLETRKSLGEAIKGYRAQCKMTQEFVAETLGVSRQAVSKWENGTSDPSTSNLIALAKLFKISTEELLREVVKGEKE